MIAVGDLHPPVTIAVAALAEVVPVPSDQTTVNFSLSDYSESVTHIAIAGPRMTERTLRGRPAENPAKKARPDTAIQSGLILS